jgi:hypothetical protein
VTLGGYFRWACERGYDRAENLVAHVARAPEFAHRGYIPRHEASPRAEYKSQSFHSDFLWDADRRYTLCYFGQVDEGRS